MSVELKDDSIKVKAALNDAIISWLYQAAEVIESQSGRVESRVLFQSGRYSRFARRGGE